MVLAIQNATQKFNSLLDQGLLSNAHIFVINTGVDIVIITAPVSILRTMPVPVIVTACVFSSIAPVPVFGDAPGLVIREEQALFRISEEVPHSAGGINICHTATQPCHAEHCLTCRGISCAGS
jgi:hypothetical protein